MRLLGVLGLGLLVSGVVWGGAGATTGAGNPPAGEASAATKPGDSAEITATGPLPEGNNGIARKYPGDAGIASDPAVIFADDFESYTKPADLAKRWDNMYQKQYVGITTAPANVYRGKQALEFTLPKQEAELSDAVEKVLRPERDILFLRYYSKYEPPYDVVGSSHNGASISAHYNEQGAGHPRRAGRRNQQVSGQPGNLARRRGHGLAGVPQHLHLPSRPAQPVGRPLLPHGPGDAQHQPGFRFRAHLRETPRRDAAARPLVLLRVHGQGEHAGHGGRPGKERRTNRGLARWEAGGGFPASAAARRGKPEDRPLRPVLPHQIQPEWHVAEVV